MGQTMLGGRGEGVLVNNNTARYALNDHYLSFIIIPILCYYKTYLRESLLFMKHFKYLRRTHQKFVLQIRLYRGSHRPIIGLGV